MRLPEVLTKHPRRILVGALLSAAVAVVAVIAAFQESRFLHTTVMPPGDAWPACNGTDATPPPDIPPSEPPSSEPPSLPSSPPSPPPSKPPPPTLDCSPEKRCPAAWYTLPKCKDAVKECIYPPGSVLSVCLRGGITCSDDDASCNKRKRTLDMSGDSCGTVGPGQRCPARIFTHEPSCQKCFIWRMIPHPTKPGWMTWVKAYECRGVNATKPTFQCVENGVDQGQPGYRVESTCDVTGDGKSCTGLCRLIEVAPHPTTGKCIDGPYVQEVACSQPSPPPSPFATLSPSATPSLPPSPSATPIPSPSPTPYLTPSPPV